MVVMQLGEALSSLIKKVAWWEGPFFLNLKNILPTLRLIYSGLHAIGFVSLEKARKGLIREGKKEESWFTV